jgi:hypothetical protein
MIELFQWWRAEMRDLGRAALRLLPSRRSPQLRLSVGGQSASLEQFSNRQWNVIGTIPRRDDGAWADELPGLGPDMKQARTAVALPAADFYFEDFELPAAVSRHLGAALRLQLERRLPVSLEQLLVDHEVVARDKQRDTLSVRCAVAHRAVVEAWRDRVAGWGLTAVSVGPGESTLNLLKRRRDPVRWSPSPLDRKLLRVAALGAALCLVLVGVQWFRERSTVNAETLGLHAQATRLEAQRVALTTRAAPLMALRSIAAAPAAPQLLAQLSTAVPTSAWFTHVELAVPADGVGSVKLIGAIPSQEDVVAALRATPGIRNVRTSAAFSGNFLGRDRVEITADYRAAAGGAP